MSAVGPAPHPRHGGAGQRAGPPPPRRAAAAARAAVSRARTTHPRRLRPSLHVTTVATGSLSQPSPDRLPHRYRTRTPSPHFRCYVEAVTLISYALVRQNCVSNYIIMSSYRFIDSTRVARLLRWQAVVLAAYCVQMLLLILM